MAAGANVTQFGILVMPLVITEQFSRHVDVENSARERAQPHSAHRQQRIVLLFLAFRTWGSSIALISERP